MPRKSPHDLITSAPRSGVAQPLPTVHIGTGAAAPPQASKGKTKTKKKPMRGQREIVRTNPGRQTDSGFQATGPYYCGRARTVLPPEPPTGWLLGAPAPAPRKKCLVLDLDETLVHSSFNPVRGADMVLPVELEGAVYNVYVRKRPGVDEFLDRVARLFEVVIFTASLSNYADPVLDHLDLHGACTARLYRESCTFCRGFFIKDLTRLGRPLCDVAIVDNSPASYQFQPANAIAVTTWYDDPRDRELYELIPLLERMAAAEDVTDVLKRRS